MKKFLLLAAGLMFFHPHASAQISNPGGGGGCIATTATLVSKCGSTKGTLATVTDGNATNDCTVGSGTNVVACLSNGSSYAYAGAAGSAPTFAQVTTGTNVGQVDTVGTGGTLNTSGTATIDFTTLGTFKVPNGTTFTTTATKMLGFDTTNGFIHAWNGADSIWPQTIAAVSHNFLTSFTIGTGAFTQAQPAISDLTATFSSPLSLSVNTLSCPTCVAASSPGVGIAHFAGSTQTVTSSALALTDIATQAANTEVANVTSGVAAPTAAALPAGGTNGCSGTSDTAIYTAGTGWGCHQISGSGTVNSGTANHLAVYASSTNAVSNDSTLTDDGTTLTYTGASGLTTTQVATTSGSKSGYDALGGNTANNTVVANTAGFMGPSSASFTAYALQLPSTAPSGTQYMNCGTPSSGVSTCAFATLSGSGTVTVVGAGSLTSTALVTGGGTTTLQTPSATSTLSSAGALSLAAGGSLKSADTGTPGFTFATNSVSLNQPLSFAMTSNQAIFGTTTNLTTLTFPASSGAVTVTMPNVTTTIPGLAVANTWTTLQTFGANAAIGSTAHGVLVSENSSAAVATAAGSAGQVLTSNGASADPTWQAASGAGSMPQMFPSRIWRIFTSDDQGGTVAIGNSRPTTTCTGGALAAVSSTATAPPMTSFTTGAVSSNSCFVTQNSFQEWLGKATTVIFESTLAATTSERWFAGLTNSNSDLLSSDAPGSDKYAVFRYSTNASDTNFMCMVSGGTAPTGGNGGLISSGVAVDTAKHVFEIDTAASIASFTFKIDGATVCTISSNLPADANQVASEGIATLTTATKAFNWAGTYIEENK